MCIYIHGFEEASILIKAELKNCLNNMIFISTPPILGGALCDVFFTSVLYTTIYVKLVDRIGLSDSMELYFMLLWKCVLVFNLSTIPKHAKLSK